MSCLTLPVSSPRLDAIGFRLRGICAAECPYKCLDEGSNGKPSDEGRTRISRYRLLRYLSVRLCSTSAGLTHVQIFNAISAYIFAASKMS
jgi:hypothetical protein